MTMSTTTNSQHQWPNGWWLNCSDGMEGIEASVDSEELHRSRPTVHLKSARVADFSENDTPKLTRHCKAEEYKGRRIKLTGWMKTTVEKSAHFWLRVDGDWTSYEPEHFDNMHDRPVAGKTAWTEYSLVADVPAVSIRIVYGLFLYGPGELWLGDVSLESVDESTPLTGKGYSGYFGNFDHEKY